LKLEEAEAKELGTTVPMLRRIKKQEQEVINRQH
jgi:hypothetical protein